MAKIKIKRITVYNVENELPKEGEIVHVIGYYVNCVYYEKNTSNHKKGFWFLNSRIDEKPNIVKEWYRLI